MSTDNLELLDKIQYPDDLRKLPIEQLPELCAELRQDIVKELSVNPGHLASSLGVVELTVALHYVLNTPYDRIVWDVGHQAYGHKILTGRKDQFYTNRKLGGIRPFPSPKESEYDTFTCGHASNSISVALGMAVAAHKNNETDRHVVAVIGETEEDFKELVEFVKWARFERMGAFAYSEEEGTYSAEHYEDDVPAEVKQRRLDKLMAVQQRISAEVEAAKVGSVLKTIIDRKEGDYYVGRTEFCSPEVDPEVLIKATRRLRVGSFYDVRITDSDDFDLYGEVE